MTRSVRSIVLVAVVVLVGAFFVGAETASAENPNIIKGEGGFILPNPCTGSSVLFSGVLHLNLQNGLQITANLKGLDLVTGEPVNLTYNYGVGGPKEFKLILRMLYPGSGVSSSEDWLFHFNPQTGEQEWVKISQTCR